MPELYVTHSLQSNDRLKGKFKELRERNAHKHAKSHMAQLLRFTNSR